MAIEHVVYCVIDVDGRFVVILTLIKFLGDADGLLASIWDLGDAVTFVDLGEFRYIRLGILTELKWSAVT